MVNLYSRDFYQLAASRLEEGGVVAQWLPLPTQNDEESRSLGSYGQGLHARVAAKPASAAH